jgi:uncharacterized protein
VPEIHYDQLCRKALRGMIRQLLIDVTKDGLPGDHHFLISFDSSHPGVEMAERLRNCHPPKFTIVLQHAQQR